MKPRAVIIDMDGTLANVSAIRHFVRHPPKDFESFHAASVDCPPNYEAVAIANQAADMGMSVLVVTARRAKWRNHTAFWLALHFVPSDALFMRHNKDHRSDVEVKRDILKRIRKTWDPVLAVDDNPSVIALWESEGIEVIRIPGWEEN